MISFRPTLLTTDIEAIAHNYSVLRHKVYAKVRFMAVVKADAYGHGAVNVAQSLEVCGADAFAVATVEEGIELREGGIQKPILVLGRSCPQAARAACQYDMAQMVFDRLDIEILEKAACEFGKRARAHLKVDTGMARIGVRGEQELLDLLDEWGKCRCVDMEGIFTHFANAAGEKEFTREQDARLCRAVEIVRANGFDPLVHASASDAATMYPEFAHDMVRVGIGLYGAAVCEQCPDLRSAQQLTTRPVRIASIAKSESVGYGRTFTAQRDSIIMTLPIGYGDGYPRAISNKGFVLVCGQRAPIVGRICMDQTMVDVTDIAGIDMEQEVVLLGRQGQQQITPDEMALWADTIPYEIMLGFTRRVARRTMAYEG